MSTEIAVQNWVTAQTQMMTKLKRYVSYFQGQQLENSSGCPIAIVNPGVLLATGLVPTLDDVIDNPPPSLTQEVTMVEDIPTVCGKPIWEILDCEPIEHFTLFKEYRDTPYDQRKGRSAFRLAAKYGIKPENLELLRVCYHWSIRATAFDTYNEVERKRLEKMRQKEIKGRHGEKAQKLFDKSTEVLLTALATLPAKDLIKILQTSAELERISAGLAGRDPGTGGSGKGGGSVDISIANQLNGPTDSNEATTVSTVTGDKGKDKERLTQVLNIMNQVGLLGKEVPDSGDRLESNGELEWASDTKFVEATATETK